MLAAVIAAACVQAPQSRAHDEAVFGHFATRGAAAKIATRARAVAFHNVNVENEGCGDWKVYVGGADTQQQRSSFAAEALKAGFPITFQQRGEPLQPPPDQVYGIFASKTTIGAANALSWKLASIGFNYSKRPVNREGSREGRLPHPFPPLAERHAAACRKLTRRLSGRPATRSGNGPSF